MLFRSARTGRVSGFGEAEMDRVGKTMKQCLSLSTLNTVPEIVTLAGILQAPTGSSGDTATGLNLILAYVRTKEKPPKKKGEHIRLQCHPSICSTRYAGTCF